MDKSIFIVLVLAFAGLGNAWSKYNHFDYYKCAFKYRLYFFFFKGWGLLQKIITHNYKGVEEIFEEVCTFKILQMCIYFFNI